MRYFFRKFTDWVFKAKTLNWLLFYALARATAELGLYLASGEGEPIFDFLRKNISDQSFAEALIAFIKIFIISGELKVSLMFWAGFITFALLKNQQIGAEKENYSKEFAEEIAGKTTDDVREVIQETLENQFFFIKRIKEITSFDILKSRSLVEQGFNSYYKIRPKIDHQLQINYDTYQNTILLGKPLSGKTRAVFELLKKLGDNKVTIYIPKKIDYSDVEIDLPNNDHRIIFFFDDINKYLSLNNIESLFQQLIYLSIKRKVWIVATCQKSKQKQIKTKLLELEENFSKLFINKITKYEKLEIAQVIKKPKILIGDDTIGSFFLPIAEMKNRYEAFALKVEKEEKDILKEEIFRTCKVFQIWGRTTTDFGYDNEELLHYLKKRLSLEYKKEGIAEYSFSSTLNFLSQSGLIELEGNKIYVEDLYLDLLIPIPQLSIFFEIINYYKDVKTANSVLKKSNSLKNALEILEKMNKLNIQPDLVTFNSIINKTNSAGEALNILGQMRALNIQADVITFTTIINKTNSVEDALNILGQMNKLNIRPNQVTFNSIINKANSAEDALNILGQMNKLNIQPDLVTFTSIINKTNSVEEALNILGQMNKLNIQPNQVTFNTIINKTNSAEDALNIFGQMNKLNIQPNGVTFNTVINKTNSLSEEDENKFFEKNKHIILNQSEEVRRHYADNLRKPEIRLELANSLKKDWNYYKITGDAQIDLNWKESYDNLLKGLDLTPKKYLPQIYALIAKCILFNCIDNKYEEAEYYCRKALEIQSYGNFHFSLKLLYIFTIQKSTVKSIIPEIQKIYQEYPFVKRGLSKFFNSEIQEYEFISNQKKKILVDTPFIKIVGG